MEKVTMDDEGGLGERQIPLSFERNAILPISFFKVILKSNFKETCWQGSILSINKITLSLSLCGIVLVSQFSFVSFISLYCFFFLTKKKQRNSIRAAVSFPLKMPSFAGFPLLKTLLQHLFFPCLVLLINLSRSVKCADLAEPNFYKY
ncbi:hypothetical protein VIGAN_09196700 [Vigna angularis var. angularis]|uniref:Uncharacterized protein n=1 Tax=Vigna angularis var. angularis TaxID=157739 RepID=A0A0S3SZV1_PHAAN|nr:hypothetical protein VIGAN_09196700 [Vigna angularis var. angularis]